MSTPFTHLLRVRYAECDAQQVVFNGKYVEYIDVAFTEFTRAIWGGHTQMLKDDVDSQLVSLKVDWVAPSHYDDVLAIQVTTVHIGNTSYTLQFDFTKHGSGERVASAQIVYVMIKASEQVKMLIPEGFRGPLELGAPNVVSDHAGMRSQLLH